MENAQNTFRLISRPNLNRFKLSIRLLKDLPEPVKISYCDQKSIDICKRYEVNSVQKLVLRIFQAALGEFEFLNSYKTQLEIL